MSHKRIQINADDLKHIATRAFTTDDMGGVTLTLELPCGLSVQIDGETVQIFPTESADTVAEGVTPPSVHVDLLDASIVLGSLSPLASVEDNGFERFRVQKTRASN